MTQCEEGQVIKLTEDDFDIYGERVKLEIWLKKWEMKQILKNQEKAEKFDELSKEGIIYTLNDGDTKFTYIASTELAKQRDTLKQKLDKIKKFSDDYDSPWALEIRKILEEPIK